MVSFQWDTNKKLSEVKTSKGKYVVWWALYCVDFVPKGKRKAAEIMHVDYPRDAQEPSEGDVYRAIIRLMAKCESS